MNDARKSRLRILIGKAAIGIAAFGVLLAYVALFTLKSATDLPILLFVGAGVYLIASFTAVICLGYVRGSKLYWALAVMRLLFAGAVIFLIVRSLNS